MVSPYPPVSEAPPLAEEVPPVSMPTPVIHTTVEDDEDDSNPPSIPSSPSPPVTTRWGDMSSSDDQLDPTPGPSHDDTESDD